MMLNLLAQICLVCSHPNAALHFSEFASQFEQSGLHYELYARGSATQILDQLEQKYQVCKQVEDFALCADQFKYLFVDVGDPFSIEVLNFFSNRNVLKIAYYDNPEPYVPGGYSETAAKVMALADVILFANAHLESKTIFSNPNQPIDLTNKKTIGLGFSTLPQDLEKIREIRKKISRWEFFSKYRIKYRKQKVAVYFGGANSMYYEKALPQFLHLLSEFPFKNYLLVFQQHPRAKAEGDIDRKQIESFQFPFPPMVLSTLSFDEAIAIADVILYYQTSATAKFFLSGALTIQVAHEPFSDMLVKNGLCQSVSCKDAFMKALQSSPPKIDPEEVYSYLGMKKEWKNILFQIVAPKEDEPEEIPQDSDSDDLDEKVLPLDDTNEIPGDSDSDDLDEEVLP